MARSLLRLIATGTSALVLSACAAPTAPMSRPGGLMLVLSAAPDLAAPVPVLPAATTGPAVTGGTTAESASTPAPAATAPPISSGGGSSGGGAPAAPAPVAPATPMPVITVAGAGTSGYAEGDATTARFNLPTGVGVDSAGNVIVADRLNHRIRRITPDGTVSTLAGTGEPGFADGAGTAAQFDEPVGLVVTADGTIYVADSWNHRIRKIVVAPDGTATVSTVAGTDQAGSLDGNAATARLDHPVGLALGAAGELFVTDTYAQTIRRVSFGALGAVTVSTVAGSPYAFDHMDGTGEDARFLLPTAIARAGDGNLYVVEEDGCYLRRISPTGVVTTLIGVVTGSCGYTEGPVPAAAFDGAQGLVADGAGGLYMADTHNGVIRRIDLAAAGGPTFTTAVGAGPGELDGGLTEARFAMPGGLALDGQGHLFVTQAHGIRRVTLPTP